MSSGSMERAERQKKNLIQSGKSFTEWNLPKERMLFVVQSFYSSRCGLWIKVVWRRIVIVMLVIFIYYENIFVFIVYGCCLLMSFSHFSFFLLSFEQINWIFDNWFSFLGAKLKAKKLDENPSLSVEWIESLLFKI